MKILCYNSSHESSWIYHDTETKELYFFSAEREYNYKDASIRETDPLSIAKMKFGFDRKNSEHILVGWVNRNGLFVDKEKSNIPEDNLYKQLSRNTFVIDHHFAHVLSSVAFNNSLDKGIAIDGQGDHRHTGLIVNNIHNLNNLEFHYLKNDPPIGKLFNLFSSMLIKSKNMTITDELTDRHRAVGKIMGLQAYGKINKDIYNKLNGFDFSLDNINAFKEYFNELLPKINVYDKDTNFDAVTTIYQFLSDKIVEIFRANFKIGDNIAYSGGCALSTVTNDKLINAGYNLTVCPAAGDMGLCIGMLKFIDLYYNLNIDFSNIKYAYYNDMPNIDMPIENIKFAAKLLNENEIIAFVNGAAEVGPRALGHRSILMNPSIPNGKDFINEKVKHREWWRPFGGSTIDTSIIKDYKASDLDFYMLKNYTLKEDLKDKLQSICHIDNSCRLQIIKDKSEPLYKVISEFNKLTNIPVLLNTSFNIAGKPIPNYKKHIFEAFKSLDGITYLFYNDKIYKKIGLSKYNGTIEIKELTKEDLYGALQK